MTSRETVRGEGDPITVSETLAPDDAEYLPETNEVEIVVARNEAGPVERATEPFARFAGRECVKAASGAVGSTISERLDQQVEHVSVAPQFDTEEGGDVEAEDDVAAENDTGGDAPGSEADVLVTYTVWMKEWEDGVKSRPPFDFDALVAVTPSSVSATVELFGREYAAEVPVFVRKTRAQLL